MLHFDTIGNNSKAFFFSKINIYNIKLIHVYISFFSFILKFKFSNYIIFIFNCILCYLFTYS